jgi:hypothetical protein
MQYFVVVRGRDVLRVLPVLCGRFAKRIRSSTDILRERVTSTPDALANHGFCFELPSSIVFVFLAMTTGITPGFISEFWRHDRRQLKLGSLHN